MKPKSTLLLPCLLFVTAAWGQITPEKAERMRLDAEMEYLNIESVKAAYDDFCADPATAPSCVSWRAFLPISGHRMTMP